MAFDPDKYLAEKEAAKAFDPDKYLEEKGVAAPAPDTDWLQTAKDALRGAAQGASFGFADELTGALESAFSDKSYTDARDESRKAYAEAQDRSPYAYGAGEIAGGFAVPVPGLGAAQGAATLGKAVARGALHAGAMGALSGLGHSEGQNLADVAKDTAIGAGVGGVVGGLTGAAVHGVGKLAEKSQGLKDKLGSKALEAKERIKLNAEKAQKELEDSALGKYRSGIQSASRDLEVIEQRAQHLADENPLKAQASSFLESPEGLAVRERVLKGKLEQAPDRIKEMDALQAEFDALKASGPESVQEAILEKEGSFGRNLKDLGKKLFERNLVPAASAVTTAATGSAASGAAVGTAYNMAKGQQGRILTNFFSMEKKPENIYNLAKLGVKATDAGKRALEQVAEVARTRGPQAAAVTHALLYRRDPEYRAAYDAQNKEKKP